MKTPRTLLISVAFGIALLGAAIHLGAVAGGPSWYEFFGAPPAVVESARAGTWLAPAGAAAIAGLMGLCAVYAVSALGLIRRMPLLRTGLFSIAAVCLVRALLLIPVAFVHPELVNTFEIVAALVWALAGFGFAAAFLETKLLSVR